MQCRGGSPRQSGRYRETSTARLLHDQTTCVPMGRWQCMEVQSPLNIRYTYTVYMARATARFCSASWCPAASPPSRAHGYGYSDIHSALRSGAHQCVWPSRSTPTPGLPIIHHPALRLLRGGERHRGPRSERRAGREEGRGRAEHVYSYTVTVTYKQQGLVGPD